MVIEEVTLTAEQDIDDVERFLLRSGRYLDAGYKLKEFSCVKGLSATFYIDAPPKKLEPGFNTKEDLDAEA